MKMVFILVRLLSLVGCATSAPEGKKGGAFISDVRVESGVLIIKRCYAGAAAGTVYTMGCAEEKINLRDEK